MAAKKPLTKAQLADQVAKAIGVPKSTASKALSAIAIAIHKSLKEHRKVAFSGLGSFDVKHRKARQGHNPATGKKIRIPAKWVPKFRPSAALKKGL